MKYKTAVMETETEWDTQWVDDHFEETKKEYPSKFVEYSENCPSCDGAEEIECFDAEENETYSETCDYCNGRGHMECTCKMRAYFITENGNFCWRCLDQEHKDAFLKENPGVKLCLENE